MLRYEVLDLRPGGGIEEVGVGHDDFFQGVGVGVGVAFQRPLGGGFAAVGGDGDGGVLALEIGDIGLDDFLIVTAGADADDDAVHSEGHAFVGAAGFFVQRRGGFGEHVAEGQQGVGLAALRPTVQTDDAHGAFSFVVIVVGMALLISRLENRANYTLRDVTGWGAAGYRCIVWCENRTLAGAVCRVMRWERERERRRPRSRGRGGSRGCGECPS